MRRYSLGLIAVAVVVVGVPWLDASDLSERASDIGKVTLQSGGRLERLPAPRMVGQGGASELGVIETIQYDNGTSIGFLSVAGVTVGNQFDTTTAGLLQTTGTISALTISMDGVNTSAYFTIFDQVAGTLANVVTSAEVPMRSGLNTITGPWFYVGSTFLAGAWQDGVPITDRVAVGTGTTNGQGFHGMTINDVVATGFNRPGTFNAIVRATVLLVKPVELLTFSVTDE